MNTAIKNVPNASLLLKTELITRHYFRVRLSCSVMLSGSHRVSHEALFWEGVSSVIIPAQGRSVLVRGCACYALALNWPGSEKANIKSLDGRRREWLRRMNRKWLNRKWLNRKWMKVMNEQKGRCIICLLHHSIITPFIQYPPLSFISQSVFSYSFSSIIHGVDRPLSSRLRFSDDFEALGVELF